MWALQSARNRRIQAQVLYVRAQLAVDGREVIWGSEVSGQIKAWDFGWLYAR